MSRSSSNPSIIQYTDYIKQVTYLTHPIHTLKKSFILQIIILHPFISLNLTQTN